MGFLPLFVALFGLVLLYSIYTYNQIKPRKSQLTRVVDMMAENSSNRKQLALKNEGKNTEPEFQELVNKLKKTSTDRFQSYKKEDEFIADFSEAAKKLKDLELAKTLQSYNLQQQELMTDLKRKAIEYNRFIEKSPAKVVASVFGFRPF